MTPKYQQGHMLDQEISSEGVYVWVLYCMDVWDLCNNVGVDMVGIVMVWLYW